ncbi:MarR family transcriptional regulator, partial [Vibrio sinaloensis]
MSECQTQPSLSDDEKLLLDNQICFPLYSAANAVIRAYRPLLDE